MNKQKLDQVSARFPPSTAAAECRCCGSQPRDKESNTPVVIQSHFDSTQHQISLVKVSNHILTRQTFYRVCHSPNAGMDKYSFDQHWVVLLSKASNRKAALTRLSTPEVVKADRWVLYSLSRRKKQDPSIRKRFRTEKTLIQDNRCYGKATLEGCQIWNFYNFIGAPVDIWEKQEKTQMWRISSHMCDPRVTWAPPGQRKTGWESQLGS